MLDKFLVLLERFVVAHELIAANSTKPAAVTPNEVKEAVKEVTKSALVKEVAEKEASPKKPSKPEPEDTDLDDEEDEPAVKPKRARKPKPVVEPEQDLEKLREEIEVMAKHIGSGESDECANELDDMLEEYDIRSVKRLKDLQVWEFHKELKAVVAKYYDIED